MSPKESASLSKAWDKKELVVKNIPTESTQVRNLIIGISTAVALTLGWVGGYAWYVSEQDKEAAAKVLKAKKRAIAVAIQKQEKTPRKALTKEERKFVQHSKKLTLSEDGEVILLTAFNPAKIIGPEEEKPKKDISVKKDIATAQVSQKTPTKKEADKEARAPGADIIWSDGRLRLTGKPGEIAALTEILKSKWDPSTKDKSKK